MTSIGLHLKYTIETISPNDFHIDIPNILIIISYTSEMPHNNIYIRLFMFYLQFV